MKGRRLRRHDHMLMQYRNGGNLYAKKIKAIYCNGRWPPVGLLDTCLQDQRPSGLATIHLKVWTLYSHLWLYYRYDAFACNLTQYNNPNTWAHSTHLQIFRFPCLTRRSNPYRRIFLSKPFRLKPSAMAVLLLFQPFFFNSFRMSSFSKFATFNFRESSPPV